MHGPARLTSALVTALTCAVLSSQVSAWQREGNNPARQEPYVILGCVSRQAGAARGASTYLITDTRGEKPVIYRLDGDAAALEFHVGHYVEVGGALAAPARGAASASGR